MREIVVMIMMLIGAFLVLVAGIGLIRMPDLFLRMSATAKAGTLGTGLMVLAAAIHFNEFSVYTRAIALIFFLIATAPISTHMLGRAAYFGGIPLWEGTIRDDLRGHYRLATHTLEEEIDPDQKVVIVDEASDAFGVDE